MTPEGSLSFDDLTQTRSHTASSFVGKALSYRVGLTTSQVLPGTQLCFSQLTLRGFYCIR